MFSYLITDCTLNSAHCILRSLSEIYNKPKFKKVVHVGNDITVNDINIDSMFITSFGSLLCLEIKINPNAKRDFNFISKAERALSNLTYDKLNAIAEEYTYNCRGQAFGIFDLLVEKGYKSYTADSASMFKHKVNRNLLMSNIDFVTAIIG